jgi:MFS superfamily sulfate permease-like transporter
LRVRVDEFLIALFTAVFVVVVAVEQAVVLAIVLSILDYVRRGYRPSRTLVVSSDGGHLKGDDLESGAQAEPGLVVYRFGADLFYANANGFTEDVLALAGGPGVEWICIDAGAISDVDYSGSKTLAELHHTLDERHVRLVLADVSKDVREQLDVYGLSSELGADAVFGSVGEAIEAHRGSASPEPSSGTGNGGERRHADD